MILTDINFSSMPKALNRLKKLKLPLKYIEVALKYIDKNIFFKPERSRVSSQ